MGVYMNPGARAISSSLASKCLTRGHRGHAGPHMMESYMSCTNGRSFELLALIQAVVMAAAVRSDRGHHNPKTGSQAVQVCLSCCHAYDGKAERSIRCGSGTWCRAGAHAAPLAAAFAIQRALVACSLLGIGSHTATFSGSCRLVQHCLRPAGKSHPCCYPRTARHWARAKPGTLVVAHTCFYRACMAPMPRAEVSYRTDGRARALARAPRLSQAALRGRSRHSW